MKWMYPISFVLFLIFPLSLKSKGLGTTTTSTPIILLASTLKGAEYSQIPDMRLFSVDNNGNIYPILFQIDQKDDYGDYVLGGPKSLTFNDFDELVFMSEDAGINKDPTHWPFQKPERLYKISLTHLGKKKSVFLGVYAKGKAPKESLSTKKGYVNLDLKNAKVETSKYLYFFNPKNYLMLKDFYTFDSNQSKKKLITASSFYLKLNLKYFFAISVNHSDVNSELEAYKVGPIRAIARVDFSYRLMSMKMNLGMYTEVVFFENSIFLPAILENPINSESILNPGSDFYYGFALVENPAQVEIKSNMAAYTGKEKTKKENLYWLSTKGETSQVYLEFKPSPSMLQKEIFPKYYSEAKTGNQVLKRAEKARPLGKSGVNIAVTADMGKLPTGEHNIELAIYIGNKLTNEENDAFKNHRSYKTYVSSLELSSLVPKK